MEKIARTIKLTEIIKKLRSLEILKGKGKKQKQIKLRKKKQK